ALDGDARALRSLAGEVVKMEGVAAAWPRERFAELGLPAEHRMLPDAVFEAEPGFQFSDETAGEDENGAPKYRGTHGQRPEAPGNAAFFLASGPGIARSASAAALASTAAGPRVPPSPTPRTPSRLSAGSSMCSSSNAGSIVATGSA